MVGKKKSIFRSPPVISWALYTIYATCLSGFLLYIKASFQCGIPRGTKGPEALLFKPILSSFYHKASLTVLAFLLLDEVKLLSRVQLFATPWTIAYQAPPSMGFSRQECWSGLPFPSPGDLPDLDSITNLPFSLEGDMISVSSSCLLYMHPQTDNSSQRHPLPVFTRDP